MPLSGQNGTQATTLQRPTTNDREAWEAYWKIQGQPWRTEPEIDLKQQEELNTCRKITPNVEQGIYPFKDVHLIRADVEWLLATHESGGMSGPVDWSDHEQQERDNRQR